MCLSLFGQLQPNTADWVASEQQRFFSHDFGGREVQDQGPAWLDKGSLLGCRLLVPFHGGRDEGALWGLSS